MLLNDKIEALAETAHDSLEEVARIIIMSNIFLTLFIALSLKSMWNLLNVMQVVTFMRFFTSWPAIVDQLLAQIFNAITLKPLVEPILQYGKSSFNISQSLRKD